MEKERKILCYSLGPKDFIYNQNTYKFQSIIKTGIDNLSDMYTKVKITNWNHSYDTYITVNGCIVLMVPFRPEYSISIKITI